MASCVKSPWKWDKVFEVCAKWLYRVKDIYKDEDDYFVLDSLSDNIEDLYILASMEEEIYLTPEMVTSFSRALADVDEWEKEHGEIIA